jgi:hypothetical protein
VTYHVQVAQDSLFATRVVDDSTLTEPSLMVSMPLAYSTTYYWRARASNALGKTALTGPWSEIWSFTVAVGTGTEDDPTLPRVLSVVGNYPNPFSQETNLEFNLPKSSEVSLRVFDALGREVGGAPPVHYPAGRHTWRFDGSGLPTGTYFYRIETDAEVHSGRMIVAR